MQDFCPRTRRSDKSPFSGGCPAQSPPCHKYLNLQRQLGLGKILLSWLLAFGQLKCCNSFLCLPRAPATPNGEQSICSLESSGLSNRESKRIMLHRMCRAPLRHHKPLRDTTSRPDLESPVSFFHGSSSPLPSASQRSGRKSSGRFQ